MENLCNFVIQQGGELLPLIIPSTQTGGTGLMNPSILVMNNKIYILVRHVNYVLYHAENIKFPHTYGPLQYLHPENEQCLKTWNYFLQLDPKTLEVLKCDLIDTSLFDAPFNCEFIGLEDARLIHWENKLYICGVRRDADAAGIGRMDLSEIVISETGVKEVSRERIPTPHFKESFCEKNWMPILDKPYKFVKWSNPIEIIQYSPTTKITSPVNEIKEKDPRFECDLRGSSQVLPYGNDYLAVVHETYNHPSEAGNKNATYRHRFIVFNKKGKIIKYSQIFSFMDALIEFCCGAAFLNEELLLTFGYQDNAAFLLKMNKTILEGLLTNE